MASRTVQVEPIRANSVDVLTKEEKRKVRKGEAQLKRGQSKPWRAVRRRLGR